jgi:hypothetical protein
VQQQFLELEFGVENLEKRTGDSPRLFKIISKNLLVIFYTHKLVYARTQRLVDRLLPSLSLAVRLGINLFMQ